MKRTVQSVALSFGLLLGAGVAAKAQLMPGMVDMMPSINTTINNSINMSRTRILSGRSRMSSAEAWAKEKKRVESLGAARIKAGKATTMFVPSVQGTEELAEAMSWDDEGDPQNLSEQVRYIQRYVKQFEMLMVQNGFTSKDSADGYAFAYALSYAAYNNKDADKAEVEKVRQAQRQDLLKALYFQGATHTSKQKVYEANVVMAMQAAEWRAKFRRATNITERKEYEQKAKEYAEAVLGKHN